MHSEGQLANVSGILGGLGLNKFDDPVVDSPSYWDLLEDFVPFAGSSRPAKKKKLPPITKAKTKTVEKKKSAKKKTAKPAVAAKPAKAKRPVPKRPKPKPKRNPWQAVTDEDSGDTYYWNEDTNETSWDKPEGMP